MTTKVNFHINTNMMEYRAVRKGTYFRYSQSIFLKTSEVVHANSSIVASCVRLSDGHMMSVDPSTMVEVFSEVDIKLK